MSGIQPPRWATPEVVKGLPMPDERKKKVNDRRGHNSPPSPWIAFLTPLAVGDSFKCGYSELTACQVNAKKLGIGVRYQPLDEFGTGCDSRSIMRHRLVRVWIAYKLPQAIVERAACENIRELWDALNMIRHAVEELGPVGCVPNAEHLGPEPMEEAEAIIKGIQKIAGVEDPIFYEI